jgi:hypothetical protein
LGRRQKEDGSRYVLDLGPTRGVRVRHGLSIGWRIHRGRRDRIDQNAQLGDLLGERDRQCSHSGFARGVGAHAGTRAPLQCWAACDVDDATTRSGLGHAPDSGSTAQKRGDEIHVQLLHQIRFAGLRHWGHCEAPCDMDRSPQVRDAGIKLRNRALIAKLEGPQQLHSLVRAQGRPLGFSSIDVGHMAERTRLDQCIDDRRAERTGSPGDDDMTIAVFHRVLPVSGFIIANRTYSGRPRGA